VEHRAPGPRCSAGKISRSLTSGGAGWSPSQPPFGRARQSTARGPSLGGRVQPGHFVNGQNRPFFPSALSDDLDYLNAASLSPHTLSAAHTPAQKLFSSREMAKTRCA
jgi:hypothetical protein